jgi:hypothetical protein
MSPDLDLATNAVGSADVAIITLDDSAKVTSAPAGLVQVLAR